MSPITHFLTGWVIANVAPLGRRERALVTAAGVVPDVDGLGVVPELLTRNSQHPLLWFSEYHHVLHTLCFAVFVLVIAFFISGQRWLIAGLVFVSFHVHLLEDLIGSRGPDEYMWPIPYLSPFSDRWTWAWQGQWRLNAWQNVAITAALLLITVFLAIVRGFSPLEIFSLRVDNAVVRTLRDRFGVFRKPA